MSWQMWQEEEEVEGSNNSSYDKNCQALNSTATLAAAAAAALTQRRLSMVARTHR